MNGYHGQIVQQHVVLESKQEPEHVLMTLQTLASHSVSKEAALWLQLIGNHGQVVQQHAIVEFKQEQEHVLTIKEVPPMSQKPSKKLVMFNNAVSDKVESSPNMRVLNLNDSKVRVESYIFIAYISIEVCATIYTGTHQSGESAALPIGESNYGLPGQSPSVMPFHDRSKSVSVSSVKGIISHALNGFEIRNPSICQNYVRFLI